MRSYLNILLALVVTLAPPGASMVAYSCDLTGDTTQIVSTLGAGNHVDECCDDEAAASHAVTSVADDCCRATVFSLPPTIHAPTEFAADAPCVLVSFAIIAPEVPARHFPTRESGAVFRPVARNFPLLV